MAIHRRSIASALAVAALVFVNSAGPAWSATLSKTVAAPGQLGAGNSIYLVTTSSNAYTTWTNNSQSSYFVGTWLPAYTVKQMCRKYNKFTYQDTGGTYRTAQFYAGAGCSYYAISSLQYKQFNPQTLRTDSSYCGYTKNSMSGDNWSAGACVHV